MRKFHLTDFVIFSSSIDVLHFLFKTTKTETVYYMRFSFYSFVLSTVWKGIGAGGVLL